MLTIFKCMATVKQRLRRMKLINKEALDNIAKLLANYGYNKPMKEFEIINRDLDEIIDTTGNEWFMDEYGELWAFTKDELEDK